MCRVREGIQSEQQPHHPHPQTLRSDLRQSFAILIFTFCIFARLQALLLRHVRPGLPEEGGPPAPQGDAAQQREADAGLPPRAQPLPGVAASAASSRSSSSSPPPSPDPVLILDDIRPRTQLIFVRSYVIIRF